MLKEIKAMVRIYDEVKEERDACREHLEDARLELRQLKQLDKQREALINQQSSRIKQLEERLKTNPCKWCQGRTELARSSGPCPECGRTASGVSFGPGASRLEGDPESLAAGAGGGES